MDNKKELEESHVKKVIGGGQLKGPSTINKLTKILFADDPEASLKNWATTSLKNKVKQTILEGIGVIMYGQPVDIRGSGIHVSSPNSYTPYNSISSSNTVPSTTLISKPVNGGAVFNGTVYFEDAADVSAYQRARDVYESMINIIAEYKWVRLAELYELAEIPGIDYVSNAWGWSDLTGTNIYPSGKGYILQLPPVRTR